MAALPKQHRVAFLMPDVKIEGPEGAYEGEAAGARLVNGPFPGTDYYVHGDWCLVQTIAQLERQGARRLRAGELEGL